MKTPTGWLLILILSFIIPLSGCAKKTSDFLPLTKSIPSSPIDDFSNLVTFPDNEITSWKLIPSVNIYDKKTIFDYIDGAAELYLAYDFSKVASAEYQNDKTSIMIDVYDMVTPENAFGVYSLNRYQDANYVSIGNEGILTDAALDFWKGIYYCKIYSFDTSDEYQKVVAEFGNKLASKIQDNGEKTAILKKLPQNGLVPKTEKFFTRKLGLDNIHFVSDENLLNLDGETKGAVAEYKLNENRFSLFIIEYPSQQKADLAFETYTKYLNEKSKIIPLKVTPKGKAKMFESEGKFTFVSLRGQTLLGFWDVESQEVAKSILQYMK